MSTCGTCWRTFAAGWQSRQQHMDATGHCPPDFECDTCDRYFGIQHAADQHMTDVGHWAESSDCDEPDYWCEDCDDAFYDEADLRDHEVEEHLYCNPCDRYFKNWNNINQHLHSKVHLNTSIQCPFCKEEHGRATGLVHHLESGRCSKAPLSRDKLYEAVRSRDPNSIISKKLLAWSGSTSYNATEKAWNSIAEAYQCYLCARLFDKLTSLNQHLSSPVHQQKLYHCPNSRCGREFTTLAGVINHLESESCEYMRFEAVQQNVELIVDPGRLISHVDDQVPSADEDDGSSRKSTTPPSPVFDEEHTGDETHQRLLGSTASSSPSSTSFSLKLESPKLSSVEASAAHAISSDLSKYPRLDQASQNEVALKYRQLDEKLRSKGLYQCEYSCYAVEFVRYAILFVLFLTFLHHSCYLLSSLCLGLLWHLLAFTVHDAGHLSITHGFHTDTCIGIFIADFLGGLSIGWWKRNHNVHHIVTNSPEHDPDIQHMPFFAISSRFFTSSLRSSYYDRTMVFDNAARFFIQYQNYLYYPILLFGRFNLYRLAWTYLLDPAQAPRKGPAWWHRYLEITGQVFFWYWFGYRTLYLSIPTWSSRIAFLLVSHMVTGTLHVQLTLSHFAMSSADVGINESFAQKMVRTTMDVDCPPWLDFVHGGLQFQVVHHLFPRLPRHNLRQAQNYVAEFCQDVGIPYVIFGFTQGNKEVISRLGEVAKQLRILEECRKAAARDLIERRHGH
ncbi:hypothetical protein QQS21_007938 [Conoideocrella luteorostrata]|uniref:C2H2-type domain-containing protein n=1 Tax=Conoideocrella luteorostrata TaxID=1105319 RepID=A0AAJ0CMJ4_9HYPO|nr:hypothetical protein QQS21_007938 [Conoideocrella luteorostrata]